MCKIKRKRINPFGRNVHAFIYLLTFFMMLSGAAYSQTGSKIAVKGVVTDATGEPLAGATVSEKGTTNGTMTGIDGDFSLSVASDGILTATYVGFNSKEVAVNGQTTINISLTEDSKVLDEVVVTALGIKRDRKSLGYALSEVKGDQLTETRDANIANSLTGKVAGLQVKSAASGAGGSSRIVLRGNSSIDGNNQPLVVVDGVPIDAGTGADNDNIWGEGVYDRGSGMSDISPDDIASISILKGPAAAALYGSRAGNGVIMITTKTGKESKGFSASYSTNLTFESPMMYPNFQNKYGQGVNGEYATSNAANSWGYEMDGKEVVDYVGRKVKYAPGADMKDFLRTGTSWTNSVEVSSSSDKNSIRFAVTDLRNKGIVPNNDFSRTSATLRATAQLTNKLSVDVKGSFIKQNTDNMVKLGASPDNIFYQFLLMPRSVQLSDFDLGDRGYVSSYKNRVIGYAFPYGTKTATGIDMTGRTVSYADPTAGNVANPYWSTYMNTTNDRKTRFIGLASLKYEFAEWLNIQGRYGIDYTNSQLKDIQATGAPTWYLEKGGNISTSKNDSYEMNADVLLTFNKQLTDKLGLVATAGGNIMYNRSDGIWSSANGLKIEHFYSLSNGLRPLASNTLYRKQINSVYGTASFAWDNMLYLDMSARNDWSSSLNSDNRSYFYPSIGASWLVTETLHKANINTGPINYGKIRLSWAQVGNDTSPYRLYNYRNIQVAEDGTLLGNKDQVEAFYNLKNETVNSWEVGLEMRAFDNRLGLDFAFYNKETKDQILRMNTPPEIAGYSYKFVNAGNVRNRGVEVLLTGTPVATKDFTWDVALNWSKNSNKILELGEGITTQILSDASYQGQIIVVAEEGGSFGDMKGRKYMRDDNGNLILDEDGLPTFNSNFEKVGNYNPDWMGGLTNTLRYKDFTLSFQIDMRYGGDVYMGSYRSGASAGTLDFTEANRADGSLEVHGVNQDGNAVVEKTNAQRYWGRLATGTEPWIYDATNIRLRELSIGYSIPRKVLAKTPIKGAKISFVGRNLWMIYSKTDGFDPEAGFSTGNAQGIETGSMPTLRSLGFNVNLTF